MEKSELLQILERQGEIIEEKIQSEKVVAGLLKDITESLDRIAGAIETQEEQKQQHFSGDLKMENEENIYKPGDEIAKEKEENLEDICTMIELLDRATYQLEQITKGINSMHESLKSLFSQAVTVNNNIRKVAAGLKAISADAEKS